MADAETKDTAEAPQPRVSTGIVGLDDVLWGGLPSNRLYLVQGNPGVGKTTLGLQFLMEGARLGERVMYVTLSETVDEIQAVAESHGWDLSDVIIREHTADDQLKSDTLNTIFHVSEVDLTETMSSLFEAVSVARPSRIVFDSLSELRLLSGGSLRYRREILSLKRHFAGTQCTVLLLDDLTSDDGDQQLLSLCHGVIILEQTAPDYGGERRRMRVRKMRGLQFRSGYHDFAVRKGGIEVFPRLIAAEHRHDFENLVLSSGNSELDKLLGGGIDRGASAILLGPSGAGKSTIATLYAISTAERGDKAIMYTMDESPAMLLNRSNGLGLALSKHVESGAITIRAVDPAEMAPGEFVHHVRESVTKDNVKTVVIDSLTGYLASSPDDKSLLLTLHELLSYLGHCGVTVILVMAQHGMLGSNIQPTVDISYLADTVLLFRYFEHAGEVRQALSVFKRRGGAHERTIRELSLGQPCGVNIGPPLNKFHGIFTGVPVYQGMAREAIEG